MTNGVLLVVDDAPANIKGLLDCLSSAGFDVLVAEHGENALTQIHYTRPDVILLADGSVETCRRLKTHAIPVIVIVDSPADKANAFAAGAADCITKPFLQEEILARMKTHLELYQLQQRMAAQQLQLEQEIAGRKQAEQDREKLIADLDAFAYTVAHDLKNPLSGVLAHAELLQEDWATESDHQKAIRAIGQGALKMQNVIAELLLLARMNQSEVCLRALDMARIVSQAERRLDYMVGEYQATIIKPDSWPVALGHAPWIEEVWVHYLSNAMKYGGTPPHIELGATPQSDGRYIAYWVKDNGCGLSQVEQHQIFMPFTRLNRVHVEGAGLGLSMVRRIVEKLGGYVDVHSDGKHGATFSFMLQTG